MKESQRLRPQSVGEHKFYLRVPLGPERINEIRSQYPDISSDLLRVLCLLCAHVRYLTNTGGQPGRKRSVVGGAVRTARILLVRGVNRVNLSDQWAEEPCTFLGSFVKGFPNMTRPMCPHQILGNVPHSVEHVVSWVARFIKFCQDHGITFAATTHLNALDWAEPVHNCTEGLLDNEVDS